MGFRNGLNSFCIIQTFRPEERQAVEGKVHSVQGPLLPERLRQQRLWPAEEDRHSAATFAESHGLQDALDRCSRRVRTRSISTDRQRALRSRAAVVQKQQTIGKQKRWILLSGFQRTLHSWQSRTVHPRQPRALRSHSRTRRATGSTLWARDRAKWSQRSRR